MDIMTLTGNLLAEWTFETGPWQAGATHRATGMAFQVGGKGINVSRILTRFDLQTEAVAFAGGPLADLCGEWLDTHGIRHRFFPLEGGARPGLVVRGPEAAVAGETTFLGKDLPVLPGSWRGALAFIRECRPRWLVIAGSFPGWRAEWLADIRGLLESAGIRVCADTYGPVLADLVRLPLDLVKINRVELEKLFPEAAGQPTAAILAGARTTSPVRNWIITDGARPVTAALGDGLFVVEPAPIREVSPTGSGDTFLAALLCQWINGKSTTEALRFAGACATANAASPGIGDFPLPVPEAYYPVVRPIPGTSA
jgi:fructose-1-phosphate kinase PfkB-like protein